MRGLVIVARCERLILRISFAKYLKNPIKVFQTVLETEAGGAGIPITEVN